MKIIFPLIITTLIYQQSKSQSDYSDSVILINNTTKKILVTNINFFVKGSPPNLIDNGDYKTYVHKLYFPYPDFINISYGDGYQYDFYIKPGDILTICENNGKISMQKKNDDIRNKEFDFFSLHPEFSSRYRIKYDQLSDKLSLRERDSMITEIYVQRNNALQKYCTANSISDSMFVHFTKSFFYAKYILDKFQLQTEKYILKNSVNSYYLNQSDKFFEKLNCDSCLNIYSYRYAISLIFKNIYYTKSYDVDKREKLIESNFKRDIKQFLLAMNVYNEITVQAQNKTDTSLLIKLCNDISNRKIQTMLTPYLNKVNAVLDFNKTKLLTKNYEENNITDMLSKFSGKIIYVDFWATWCKPCLAQMPYSLKLHEKLKGEKIIFLYFSLDENKIKWQEFISKNFLLDNSYLVENGFESELADKLRIKEIPRYIIFDKSGRIVNSDAPRPSDKKLEQILLNLSK